MEYAEYKEQIEKQAYYIEGQAFTSSELRNWASDQSSDGYIAEIKRVVSSWFDEKNQIEVHTSGSTGRPKRIKLKKDKMFYSARMSLKFFDLKPMDKVLLVLPADKIGGLMLIIRSLVGGLDLYFKKPALDPFKNKTPEAFDFCSLTPAQFQSIVSDSASILCLNKIKKILLGGSALSRIQVNKIRELPSLFYHSYGMTETISHIAVRNLSEGHEYFSALDGVLLKTDDSNQLIIEAPLLLEEPVLTNDIVEIQEGSQMIWKGRKDNVINSGGIKFIAESLEKKIEDVMAREFYFTSQADDILGEKLVLIIKIASTDTIDQEAILNKITPRLSKLELPKNIYFTRAFNYTKNGKLIRSKPDELSIHGI